MNKHTLTFSLAVLMISSVSYAQKSKWGLQAGATYANLTIASDGESESGDYKPGFTVGAMLDKQIGKTIFFQPALNFVQKGYKDDRDGDSFKVSFNYLELPLNFVYRSKKESGFFIGGGPSIGCGLGGNTNINGEKENIDFGGDDNPDLFEVEANLLTGYMFPKKLQVSFNFNFGITSLMDSKEVRAKNNYFGLRLGYYFN